ncbi:MAG: Hsp20/alpha crystallin family protein [Spirochaetes bacterium]|nr:Hsp20/alpha crystallin family protein [Spirochaetota bacterium]
MTAELTKIKNDAYKSDEYIIVPSVDIYENENEFVITAEMPGVDKDGIDLTLNNEELEINGKINGNLPAAENIKYEEFRLYNYYRKFNVGDSIDSTALKAGLDNGILTVTLPKKEEVKPRKIEVKVEH